MTEAWRQAPIAGAPTTPATPQAAPVAQPASGSWRDAPIAGQRNPKADTAFGTVKDFVTGESKIEFPDLPNINELNTPFFDGGSWRAAAGLLVATDKDQKLDILRKSFPDAKFTADAYGNPIMEAFGQKVYVDKPGLRAQDVIQGVGQAAAFVGAGRALPAIAGAVPGLKTAGAVMQAMPGVVQAAGTGAATSAALDLAANAAGAEKVIDLPRAGINAGAGAAFEMFSPLVNKGFNLLRNVFGKQQFVDAAGNLTPEATVVLERAGIDPTQVSTEFKDYFSKMAKDAANPEDAARLAQSETLPVRVPETRGTLSGLPSDQMTESMAAKGAYGEDAQRIMRGMVAEQQDALRGNVEAIQQRLGGGQVVERGQGGAAAQRALVEAQNKTKAATSAAYNAAERAPAAMIRRDPSRFATEWQMSPDPFTAIDDFRKRVTASASNYLRHAPKASSQAKSLESLMQRDGVTIKDLFDWRRDTSELYRAIDDKTEGAAFKTMLGAFDDGVEDLLKKSLFSGNEESAKKWLRAVSIRRGEARRFGSQDLISDLLEKEFAGGGPRLKVAPEQAANYIFGAADTGFISKPQLARDLSRLRGRLGETSDAWKGLKEEAWLRFANQGEGAAQGATRGFSGVKFKKAWDQAWSKNGPTMRVLFDEKERKLIDTFAEVAARVTGKVAGGDNPSGTTIALANAVQKLGTMAFLGPKAQLLLQPVVGAAVKFKGGQNIGKALAQPLRQKQLPQGVVSGVGTAATNLIQGDDR